VYSGGLNIKKYCPMKKLIVSLFLPAFLLLSFWFTSCDSSNSEIYVTRDTVVIDVDTLVKEQKKAMRVKLNLFIQIAAFSNRVHAEDFSVKVKESLNTYPEIKTDNNNFFLVTVGSFTDNKKAEEYLIFVKSRGFKDAFIKNF